jgi:2-alkenal reductase
MDTTRGRLGDVITQVNGKNVSNLAEMAAALDGIGIGKRAELTVMRDGRSRKVPVEITDISSESAAR